MSIKLVVLDMDGTLLNDDHQVSHKNRMVIRELMEKGVDFILASGRSYESIYPYTKDLNLDLPIISSNGAFVKSPVDHKVYFNSVVPLDLAQEVIDYGLKHSYPMSLYFEDKVFSFDEKLVTAHRELEGIKATLIKEARISQMPTKIIYFDKPDRISKAFGVLEAAYEDELYVTASGELYLDIMNLDTSKGNAVKYLIDKMKIPQEQVMAIGNNFNDVPMFEYAGLSVAMENSPEEVKKRADYVTKSNREDGVAFALERFLK